MDEREAKLPKWAQESLHKLRGEIYRANERIQRLETQLRGEPSSIIYARDSINHASTKFIPSYETVEFDFQAHYPSNTSKKDWRRGIQLRFISPQHEFWDGEGLVVLGTGGGGLSVEPQSGNALVLRVTSR